MILENEIMQIELDSTLPIVNQYFHKPTGQLFGGANTDGELQINGCCIPWPEWQTVVTIAQNVVSYQARLKNSQIVIHWQFTLEGSKLSISLIEINDPEQKLESIGWSNLPILICNDSSYRYWHMSTGQPDPNAGYKMWATDAIGVIAELDQSGPPKPLIYGAIWNNQVCAFVDSNYPLFPIIHQRTTQETYTIALNTYQYRVRDKVLPMLKVTVGFLGDINGDQLANLSDYRLWINRSHSKGDSLYYDAVKYKILMHYAPPDAGSCTNLEDSEEIIKAMFHITDGLPQIIYLVGQQLGGHDGTYPTLGGGTNPEIGTEEQLRQLSELCQEKYNAILSYHCNIDDAYRNSQDWDHRYVVESGNPGEDALNVHGSISHTLDVETNEIFRRLEEYMECFPIAKTLHLDNMRLTNTLYQTGWEEIGVIEELVCGLMPIMEWLKKRGITITTEGHNGLPIDPSILVSGFWHYDSPDRMRQILHRRISGGGRGSHLGQYTTTDYGICNSLHIDLSYRKWPPDDLPLDVRQKHFGWMPTETLTWTLKHNWKEIVDCIYLGTLLHHFYNEREMLIWDEVGNGWRITYAGDVVAEVGIQSQKSLKVTMKEIIVAEDNDRFIPIHEAIYAYSKDGSNRDWRLPLDFQGVPLQIFTLSKDGRGSTPDYKLSEQIIHLKLEAGVPVKIEKR